jgi:hypothetical protein
MNSNKKNAVVSKVDVVVKKKDVVVAVMIDINYFKEEIDK